jgi:hypothetical protein
MSPLSSRCFQVISFIELYTFVNWYWSVPDHGGFFRLAFQELKHLAFALSFVFNLLVTIAIATRRFLAIHGKSTIPDGGSFPLNNRKRPAYNKAKILLVDAALPATLSSLCILIVYSQYVQHWKNSALNVQGIFAVLWLMSSVRALRSWAPGFSSHILFYQDHSPSSDCHSPSTSRGEGIL